MVPDESGWNRLYLEQLLVAQVDLRAGHPFHAKIGRLAKLQIFLLLQNKTTIRLYDKKIFTSVKNYVS